VRQAAEGHWLLQREMFMIRFYKTKKEFPFTFLTHNDTYMVLVPVGIPVKIDFDKRDLWVRDDNGKWNLTNNIVDDFMIGFLEEEDVHCIGRGNDDGCGYQGGVSGQTCPECGGMLLSKAARDEADKIDDMQSFLHF